MMERQNTDQLTQLAQKVLQYYGITPEGIRIIQSKGLKTLWKFSHEGMNMCLKRLRHSKEKVLFSVHAQMHINQRGGSVPDVILNQSGSAVTNHDGQLFVLYGWIDGRDLNFDNPGDLALAVEGLAGVHKASVGYKPPEGARVSSKLGKWPGQYQSMRTRLAEWKELARPRQQPNFQCFLKHAGRMLEIADRAIEAVHNSCYAALTGEEYSSYPLCHQDYGRGNVLWSDGKAYVLDFDGVTYDLVARDLRKIIGKQMEDGGGWNGARINEIIKWYENGNKLTDEEKEILTVDLMFPHWFFAEVKDLFKKNKPVPAGKIERAARFEEAKIPVLKGLSGGSRL